MGSPRFASLALALLLTVVPLAASAETPNDTPERAVVLAGTVGGDLEAVPPTLGLGKYAFLRFEYPGDHSTVTIGVDFTPGDPAAVSNAGFKVYGPTNGRLYATSAQTGRHPSHEAQFASTEPGTYLVQVYSANLKPIHYEASAKGLPPQATPTPEPTVTPEGEPAEPESAPA